MSDKMRAEFEALMTADGAAMYLARDADGDYVERETGLAWHWFALSRATLVVELPEPDMIEISAEESLEMDFEEFEEIEARNGAQAAVLRKCRTVLEALGLQVKP